MGMFQVRVRVSNPADRSRFFEADFWVDTGALYSFIPEGRLQEIGISPVRARELILADGRRDRRLLGEAVLGRNSSLPRCRRGAAGPADPAPGPWALTESFGRRRE